MHKILDRLIQSKIKQNLLKVELIVEEFNCAPCKLDTVHIKTGYVYTCSKCGCQIQQPKTKTLLNKIFSN